jgi:hypothetical protein
MLHPVAYYKHPGHKLPYPYQEPNKVYMNTCTLPDSENLKDIVLLFELGGDTMDEGSKG